ncbi:MAG: COX15/CtaA family protein [Saprospiraceae bacterium]|nr:COX15/CtaA family protein [Saprospiraceae bacterium]
MNYGKWQKWIYAWLLTGLIMILVQIFLGGVTRLTGSGLSITRWDIVTGIIYPLSEEDWDYQFGLYKQTPQYQKINQGISIDEFKYIFFWEYTHRLWARIMGFVFVIPFLLFLVKRVLSKSLIFDLMMILFLASIVASLGWIMVASGLLNRPWVNAYKLSFHLMAAIALVSYLIWTIWKLGKKPSDVVPITSKRFYSLIVLFPILLFIQLFLGGIIAGMKAAMVAPTWPDINGFWIPREIVEIGNYFPFLFDQYESNAAAGIIMQFFHRSVAYLLTLLGFILFLCSYQLGNLKIFRNSFVLFILLIIQIILGVITLLGSVGEIPIWSAVGHQLVGVLLYCMGLYNLFGAKAAFSK